MSNKKGKRILVFLVLALLLGVLTCVILALTAPSEPMYEGKPLTYWLKKAQFTTLSVFQDALTRKPIESLGTNAIPTLLRLLRAKDSATKLKLMWALERLPLINFHYWNAMDRNMAAFFGFSILGPKAAPAVPELIEILNEHISEVSESGAIEALGSIGPNAKPAVAKLLELAAMENGEVRTAAVEALKKIDPESLKQAIKDGRVKSP